MEKLVLSQAAEFPWAQQLSNAENDVVEDSNSLALHTNGDYQEPSLLLPTELTSATTGSALEYPTASQSTKEEDNGLVLPTGGRIVNQGDGNFELTIEVESKDDAIKFMKELKKRNKKKIRIRQADGLDSEDDEDEEKHNNDDGFGSDDINSDLDDSDSLESEDDSDDQEGNIMLCLYDKVQRVKNKWKCNLKEGIASLNGKDYTFQKATSESEW